MQLRLGDTDAPRPQRLALIVKPDARLTRNPDYIHQYVEKCPYGCGEALLVQEWIDGGHPITILSDPLRQHRETCPGYHKNRITIDDETSPQ